MTTSQSTRIATRSDVHAEPNPLSHEAQRMPATTKVVRRSETGARRQAALTIEDGESEDVFAPFEVRRKRGMALLMIRHGGAAIYKSIAVPVFTRQPSPLMLECLLKRLRK